MDLMEDENDEDLTYLNFIDKNGVGVQILYRSYSRKEELWRLSPLFCCLQGTKTLNNLKKYIHKCHLLNESSFVVDYFVYLCVQIKDICK